MLCLLYSDCGILFALFCVCSYGFFLMLCFDCCILTDVSDCSVLAAVFSVLCFNCCVLTVVSCEWQNMKCGPENFTQSLTDHGVCFTFTSNDGQPLLVASTGTVTLTMIFIFTGMVMLTIDLYFHMYGHASH